MQVATPPTTPAISTWNVANTQQESRHNSGEKYAGRGGGFRPSVEGRAEARPYGFIPLTKLPNNVEGHGGRGEAKAAQLLSAAPNPAPRPAGRPQP